MNHKQDFYFSELLQSLKLVSLFIYFVGNSGRYISTVQLQREIYKENLNFCWRLMSFPIFDLIDLIYQLSSCTRLNSRSSAPAIQYTAICGSMTFHIGIQVLVVQNEYSQLNAGVCQYVSSLQRLDHFCSIMIEAIQPATIY